MQKRNPKAVFFLHALTLGIYLLVWCNKSKKEINTILGQKEVPTLWWFALPFGSFWWIWLYSQALEKATGKYIKRDFTFGIWIIATLSLGGYFNLDNNLASNPNNHLSTLTIIIVALVLYVIFTLVLGIFPTVMQSKINSYISRPNAPPPVNNT